MGRRGEDREQLMQDWRLPTLKHVFLGVSGHLVGSGCVSGFLQGLRMLPGTPGIVCLAHMNQIPLLTLGLCPMVWSVSS